VPVLAPRSSVSPQVNYHSSRLCLGPGYDDGGDVAARLPLLSTYLGHVDPKSTYWYLQATPELLAAAAERLEHAGAWR
jgi:hypothetical protein